MADHVLAEERHAERVKELMAARRAVGAAKRTHDRAAGDVAHAAVDED